MLVVCGIVCVCVCVCVCVRARVCVLYSITCSVCASLSAVLCLTYHAVLVHLGQHDNPPAPLPPHHLPEVTDCVGQWALCCNVGLRQVVPLSTGVQETTMVRLLGQGTTALLSG